MKGEDNVEILEKLNLYKRQPLYNGKLPFILLWSQKAGCTNFTKWFFYQAGLYEKALEFHPSIHVYKAGKYFKRANYLEEVRKQLYVNKMDVIKLVRNPYMRAVSSFLTFSSYCYSSKPKGSRMYQDWLRVYDLFYSSRSPYEGLSFKQFLYFLDSMGSSIANVDGHLAQQYIEGEENLKINFIKVENFLTDIRSLEQKYQLKKSPQSLISQQKNHHGPKMSLHGDYSKITITSEILLNEKLPTYESFYDKENLKLCEKIFRKDIQRYNYKTISQ